MWGARSRRVQSALLAAIFLGGGPGLAVFEGAVHATNTAAGHASSAHYEARGGEHHGDHCLLGWPLPASRSAVVPHIARLLLHQALCHHAAAPVGPSHRSASRFHPSRAPPAEAA